MYYHQCENEIIRNVENCVFILYISIMFYSERHSCITSYTMQQISLCMVKPFRLQIYIELPYRIIP